MNSSEALTSQGALQGLTNPCNSQDWMPGMNGLFDTCGTEGPWDIDSKVTSELANLDVETIDASDLELLSSLPPCGDITDFASPTESESDALDYSFMEIFTDLNDIMKMAEPEVTVDPIIDLDPTIQECTITTSTTSTSKRGRKRKATVPASETTPTGEDHLYTSKKSKKAPAVSKHPEPEIDIEGFETSPDVETHSPAELKKDKYTEKRRKNNIASRKSRQTRKTKNSSLEQQAEDLEIENETLKTKIAEAEALTKELKDLLVSQLSGAKK